MLNTTEFRRWMVVLIILILMVGSQVVFAIYLLDGIQQFLLRTR